MVWYVSLSTTYMHGASVSGRNDGVRYASTHVPVRVPLACRRFSREYICSDLFGEKAVAFNWVFLGKS